MKSSIYVALALSVVFCFVTSSVNAIAAEERPNISTWVNGLDQNKFVNFFAPYNILIAGEESQVSDWAKKKSFADFDFKSCHAFSYLKCVNSMNFEYALKINHFAAIPSNDDLMALTDSNCMVIFESLGTYFLPRNVPQRILIKNQERITIRSDVRQLFSNVFASLGYDGVVLDVRGQFALIGGIDGGFGAANLKVKIFRNSEKSILFEKPKSDDDGLTFSVIEARGSYAIVKIRSDFSPSIIVSGQKVLKETGL